VRTEGFIPIWRKDDKYWLEIAPERMGKPFLFTANISQSVGERGLYASQMGPDWLVEWRKVGNAMQLVALNTAYRPGSDFASREAVRQAFSESLVASTAVVSAPHLERKSVLVDASFLLADLASYATRIEEAFRLPFGLDRGNSNFESTRADAGLTVLTARLHFSTPRLPASPLVPSPVRTPPPPQTTPDARSLFVTTVYSFLKLPDQPMAARMADPRLGHFTRDFFDFSDDSKPRPRVHNITRWRLEKKDPLAELSEPVKPITYWLDRNIPQRYRGAVSAGILEWNKAFEKIGFRNAIVVQQQADDADFDTLDAAHASVRWFVGADVGFAIGPSDADPRTGEILDADIGMSDVFSRYARRDWAEELDGPPPVSTSLRQDATCNYAHEAAVQMSFAMDLLEARGEMDPNSPEAEAFVQATIKDIVMHELGHTLGLKHNFKASTTITQAQLRDKTFTQEHGITGSVMDYNPLNLPLKGEPAGLPISTTLGAYDYWAIEYAYRPLAADREAEELARIASRSTEPALAYADDADAEGGPTDGLDPWVNRFDLGDDPLAWGRKQLALSKELWQRLQVREPRQSDDPLRARRVLLRGFAKLRNIPGMVAKFVGGMETGREPPGVSMRPAYVPVAPARQREALKFLADGVFSADSFVFQPRFLASISPDYLTFDRERPVSIPAIVLGLQVSALDRLLSPGTAQRVLDLLNYLPTEQRKGALTLDEVYGSLQASVWSELKTGREIEPLRRNLQREHLKRLQGLLTRGTPGMPADAISLVRWHANELLAALKRASAASGLSVVTRAHLAESVSSLGEALKASMSRV
jgi:hypothetical protein